MVFIRKVEYTNKYLALIFSKVGVCYTLLVFNYKPFETAASEFRDGIKDLGNDAQKNLSDISDGLKPWERLP